jgi:GAF domain-containing protein
MNDPAAWLRPLSKLWNSRSYRARYALFGAIFGMFFPLTSSLIWVWMNRLPLTFENFLQAQVNNPLQWMIDSAPFFLGLFASFAGKREDSLKAVNRELENRLTERSRMVAELDSLRSRLEMQVSKQVAQLRLTAQVSSDALHAKDLQQVMDLVVRLISERLGFYHAGIFLLDDTHEYAVLRAASSKGGQVMLHRNHRLQVGQVGIVGYVAAKGEPRVAHDVGKDAAFFNNPDLPATRSEVALPLKIGSSVFGVLDIQSVKMGDFTPEDVAVLQTMADQVSLVIENARLSSERSEALKQLREFQSRQSRDAWRTVLADRPRGVVYDGLNIRPSQAGQIPSSAEMAPPANDPYVLHQKIVYQEIPIGTLVLTKPSDQGAWSVAEKKFVQSVAAQIALAVENTRLLDENQRRAQSEQMLGAISAHAHASLDLDAVMKISVQEIGRALGAMRVEMRLETENPNSNGNNAMNAAQPRNGRSPAQTHPAEES